MLEARVTKPFDRIDVDGKTRALMEAAKSDLQNDLEVAAPKGRPKLATLIEVDRRGSRGDTHKLRARAPFWGRFTDTGAKPHTIGKPGQPLNIGGRWVRGPVQHPGTKATRWWTDTTEGFASKLVQAARRIYGR